MWKSIADDYEVSTDGQVRSWKSGTPKLLKPQSTKYGYLEVGLYIDGKHKHCSIHRLVAEAFIPNPDGKPQVNHLNGIKTDNRVENLEWCTNAENHRHAYAAGLQIAPQGEDSCRSKLTNEQARYVRDNPNGLTRKALAEQFGVNEGTVSAIQLGKIYKTAGGSVRDKRGVPDNIRDEIRRLYQRGKPGCGCQALGKKFAVDRKTIWKIVRES